MQYMLLVYAPEGENALTGRWDLEALRHAQWSVMKDARAQGVFLAAEPLLPTDTATTVRRRAGKLLITDGPFAQTQEQLVGCCLLECRDLDEALTWAARIPICADGVGGVEIRPIARQMR